MGSCETLRSGLLAGSRDLTGSGKRVFFDYLKAVASYEEFGADRGMLVAKLEEAEKDELFNSVQKLLPWVTDVFIHGILAGEEAQNVAKRGLLERYAKFPETAAAAQSALSLDRMRMVEGSLCGESGDEGAILSAIRQRLHEALNDVGVNLSEIRWCLKYLPSDERELCKIQTVDMLEHRVDNAGCPQDESAPLRCFCGKYRAMPVSLGMEQAYKGLRGLPLTEDGLHESFARNKCLWREADDIYQAELSDALRKCVRTQLRDERAAREMGRAAETLLDANNVADVLSMCYIPDDVKERIANGIVGIELLWALAHNASRRMNMRGSGAIPAFNLAGRITRDGRAIESSAGALYSVEQALDFMVQDAVCQLSAGREINGVNVVTYEPFREYREGEFSEKHLTALIDNAIANKRYAVVRPKGAVPVVTIPIDAPVNPDDEGEESSPLVDMLPGKEYAPPDDYSNFVFVVTKRFAPTMWQYLRLVEWGISASDIERLRGKGMSELTDKYDPGDLVSKGDALKMVGAKTPHLVERERAALLKALDGVAGIDFQEMARKLKKALEK